jgi:hypothetical protein
VVPAAPAAAAELPVSGTLDLGAGADLTLEGVRSGDAAGWAVADVGDVNGDGRSDVAIAAPTADPRDRENAGSVYVVFGGVFSADRFGLGALGAQGFRIDGAAAGDRLGTAVEGGGDIDGDGKDDVLVGAPGTGADERPGAAYVVAGRGTSTPVDLAGAGGVWRIEGAGRGDQAGTSLAAGDVDGDAVNDVIVGASHADHPERRDAGAGFVVFTRRPLADVRLAELGDRGFRIDGPQPGALAGLSAAASPDLDTDDRAEVVLGAPQAGEAAQGGSDQPNGEGAGRRPGAAFVVRGATATDTVDLAALGERGVTIRGQGGEAAGLSVGTVPDLTGDGLPEIGVGAPQADRNGRIDSGSLHVVAGRASGEVELAAPGAGTVRVDGALIGDAAGAEVGSAGDVDGDGRQDLLLTAPFADPLARRDAGAAYVVFASSLREDVDLNGLGARGVRLAGAFADDFVRSATATGDFEGDGGSDVVVGELDGLGRRPAIERPGGAHLVSLVALPPVEPQPPDPGAEEEVALDSCRAADAIQFVVDDSGSMVGSDEDDLRVEAIELLLGKPRNDGRIVGATQYGQDAEAVFPPQPVYAEGPRANVRDLRALLDQEIGADDGGTDLNAAFAALGEEHPDADARILITDGGHSGIEPYASAHRGGPPTYVIGIGVGRRGAAGQRLTAIARDTGGRYYARVRADRLHRVLNQIDSRMNCDLDLDAFTDVITTDDDELEAEEILLEPGISSVDVTVSWPEEEDELEPDDLVLEDEEGDVVDEIDGALLGQAIRNPGIVRDGDVTIRGEQGRTFFTLRLSGPLGRRLVPGVRARTLRGGRARVTVQVAESRRRR